MNDKPNRRRVLSLCLALSLVPGLSGCGSADSPHAAVSVAAGATRPARGETPATARDSNSVRDLSIDESMGGHTLARHVGKTDAELADRLRREPQISSASTYTDRTVAERVVATALASETSALAAWRHRDGRRPNLVLRVRDRTGQPIGRSLSRGRQASVPCSRALVVLRWDERAGRFYVLTSYPESGR